MNPGIGEEVGQTGRDFIKAMSGNPALLGMIVANLALLAFIYYAMSSAAAYRETLTREVLSNSSAIHQILARRAVACPDPG
jgi:hypothetical protein